MKLMSDPLYCLIHGSEDIYSGIDTERYEKILYGWNSDNEIFCRLIEENNPKYILEIGSWLGSSVLHMGNFIKSKGLNTKIVCVDTWLGSKDFIGKQLKGKTRTPEGLPSAFWHFMANVKREGLSEIVIPFPQTSTNALHFFSENDVKFQMVYIDGSNQYEDIKSDIDLSWGVLDVGGVIFGDDYINFSYPQINAAVNSFVYENRIRDRLVVDSKNVFWSIKKKRLI